MTDFNNLIGLSKHKSLKYMFTHQDLQLGAYITVVSLQLIKNQKIFTDIKFSIHVI